MDAYTSSRTYTQIVEREKSNDGEALKTVEAKNGEVTHDVTQSAGKKESTTCAGSDPT